MATFLALAQKLASESGTVQSASSPVAVTGQTGRLGKIVRWTNDAWRSIQNAHGAWRWLQAEFSGSTIDGQQRYTSAQMSIASRFGEWVCRGNEEDRYSIYDPAVGVTGESELRFIHWDDFYRAYVKGDQSSETRPSRFSIAPDNQICFHPIPDKVYTVRGPYRKDVQEMTADGDIPEMPVRFHDLIVETALEFYLDPHDEALALIPAHRLRRLPRFSELERDQLPPIRLAGALA